MVAAVQNSLHLFAFEVDWQQARLVNVVGAHDRKRHGALLRAATCELQATNNGAVLAADAYSSTSTNEVLRL